MKLKRYFQLTVSYSFCLFLPHSGSQWCELALNLCRVSCNKGETISVVHLVATGLIEVRSAAAAFVGSWTFMTVRICTRFSPLNIIWFKSNVGV